MLKSWRLGRLFGFPIEINVSFLVLLALVFVASGGLVGVSGGLAGVFGIALVFGSVILHELGHALVARRLGVRVSGIELSFLGGAAKLVQMPRSANDEIAIAAAGPVVSLVLGGLGLGLGVALHAPLIGMIGWINVILAAFNLIPALPMDGGRILRAVLSRRMDFVRATDVAVQVSRVVAIGFGVLGLLGAYQLLVLAPFLWMMGTRERLIARATGAPYAGWGGSSASRGGGPFGGPGRPGGFHRSFHDDEGPVRQFTMRQVGGRLVIRAIDR